MNAVVTTGTLVLPEVVPVFPLPGVVLLPHGYLPLNIFEPRYVNLVEDALGAGRLMAMVQPTDEGPDPVPDGAEVFTTGCVGRIVSFMETGKGGYMVNLLGLSRFEIAAELKPANGYRRVRARYEAYVNDLQENPESLDDRNRLLHVMTDYFEATEIGGDWQELEEAPDSVLVTSLAMICPFEAREKQALLECAGLQERGQLLIALMEMAALDKGEGLPTGGVRH